MEFRRRIDRRSWRTRVGVAVLGTALVGSAAGCGSRATDAEIVEALRGAPAVPAAAGPNAITGDPAATQAVVPAGAAQPGSSLAAGTSSGPTATTTSGNAANTSSKSAGNADAANKAAQAVAAPAGTADKSVVKIGTVGPFSGVIGAVAEGAPKTLGAWVAYTNARGGINGHPIKLIVADDQADPSTGLTLIKRLVESDGVIAMVGNLHIFGFTQVEQYLRSKNVPLIGGDGVDPGWMRSPIAFPTGSSAADQTIAGLKMFVADGAKKLGMLYCLEASAVCSYLHDQVRKSPVGAYLKQSYQVSLVAPSYTSQCLRMKQENIEAVYLLMDTAGGARIVKDCAAQGFKPRYMLLGLDATKDLPITPGLEGTLIPGATMSPAARDVPAIKKYHEVMNTYGSSVGESGLGMVAFAAAELFALVGKDLSDTPSSAELFIGLWKVKNETLSGLTPPFTFGKGALPQAKPCMFLWGAEGGKFSAPQGSRLIC